MKKTSLYILLICSVFSCKDVNDLNGSWIIVDSQNEFQKENTFYEVGMPPENNIISFNDGTYKLLNSGFGVNPEQFEGVIQVKRNSFLTGSSENGSEFKKVNSNIIKILSTSSYAYPNKITQTYRRIDDSLKHKSIDFSLVDKKYFRQYESYTDTVHFLNDSIYTSSSWSGIDGNTFNYHRFEHNGFDILFTDKYPPFIIKNIVKDTIYISTFSEEKEDYIMTKVLDNN